MVRLREILCAVDHDAAALLPVLVAFWSLAFDLQNWCMCAKNSSLYLSIISLLQDISLNMCLDGASVPVLMSSCQLDVCQAKSLFAVANSVFISRLLFALLFLGSSSHTLEDTHFTSFWHSRFFTSFCTHEFLPHFTSILRS